MLRAAAPAGPLIPSPPPTSLLLAERDVAHAGTHKLMLLQLPFPGCRLLIYIAAPLLLALATSGLRSAAAALMLLLLYVHCTVRRAA